MEATIRQEAEKISRQAILKQHSIETRITNGRLEALSVCTVRSQVHTDWIDVTDYSIHELYRWLGY